MNLPQYIPRSSVEFIGALHSTVTRAVRAVPTKLAPVIFLVQSNQRDRSHEVKGQWGQGVQIVSFLCRQFSEKIYDSMVKCVWICVMTVHFAGEVEQPKR